MRYSFWGKFASATGWKVNVLHKFIDHHDNSPHNQFLLQSETKYLKKEGAHCFVQPVCHQPHLDDDKVALCELRTWDGLILHS